MEDNEEEEEDDDMYPNYGYTATGHDEDEEAGGAEDEEASDEPVEDDLRRAIADAHREAESANEKRKLKGMLEDHKKSCTQIAKMATQSSVPHWSCCNRRQRLVYVTRHLRSY